MEIEYGWYRNHRGERARIVRIRPPEPPFDEVTVAIEYEDRSFTAMPASAFERRGFKPEPPSDQPV